MTQLGGGGEAVVDSKSFEGPARVQVQSSARLEKPRAIRVAQGRLGEEAEGRHWMHISASLEGGSACRERWVVGHGSPVTSDQRMASLMGPAPNQPLVPPLVTRSNDPGISQAVLISARTPSGQPNGPLPHLK